MLRELLIYSIGLNLKPRDWVMLTAENVFKSQLARELTSRTDVKESVGGLFNAQRI